MSEHSIPTVASTDVDALVGDGWTLVDVRTEQEWAGGRIDGAVHIPLDQLPSRTDELPDRVVFVCALGGRSARATAFLIDQGRQAVNLDGGVQAWVADGRPLVS